MDGVLLSSPQSTCPEHLISLFLLTCSFFLNLCRSAGDKDAAPSDSSKEGVGGSSQLHLWTEGGLHPPVQGSEGGHVSAPAPV